MGFIVRVSGFRVSGFGFRVQDSGCRIQDFGRAPRVVAAHGVPVVVVDLRPDRGTSLIRNSTPPLDHRRALGIILL